MMWSNKKWVDNLINILIFCLSMNLFHIGQFALPLICLILFVDNGFKLKISNIKVFVLLCLFSISFFIFSYDLGFYSVMGFCLPMAYYIGNNLIKSEENIKKLIYIIALGMGAHVILNLLYEFYLYGFDFVKHGSHLDIWTQSKIAATTTATNYMIIIGCIYFIIFKEKNKKNKLLFLFTFLIMMYYNLYLGRRTPILILPICLIVCFVCEFLVFNGNKKLMKKILLIFTIVFTTAFIFWLFDLLGFKTRISGLPFYKKFLQEGLSSGRLEILIEGAKLMPYYLWGGQNISNILGIGFHDLWTDIYDYAGIIPFVLFVIYTVYDAVVAYKVIRNNKNNNDLKLLLIGVLLTCFLQSILEPLLTGSSILLICIVIIYSSLEGFTEA